jgi:hypothetical protein
MSYFVGIQTPIEHSYINNGSRVYGPEYRPSIVHSIAGGDQICDTSLLGYILLSSYFQNYGSRR